MDLVETETLINDAHLKGEYRPVIVAIIKNKKERILLIRSAKNKRVWYLPQGGIEYGELVETALFREIEEELGIAQKDLTLINYLGFEDLDAEKSRRDRRGFIKGKRYFFFTLFFIPSAETLNINHDEVSNYLWTPQKDITHILTASRIEKRKLLLKWLNVLETVRSG